MHNHQTGLIARMNTQPVDDRAKLFAIEESSNPDSAVSSDPKVNRVGSSVGYEAGVTMG